MKSSKILIVVFVALVTSCGYGTKEYDASGVFETTEVLVSSKGVGELKQFEIKEGQRLDANIQIGYIDTTQLYLKKVQLRASIKAISAQLPDATVQIAVLEEQLAKANKEKERTERLIASGSATQKLYDDCVSQVALLNKQLKATSSQLNTQTKGLLAQIDPLKAQIAQIDDQILNNIISSPINGVVLTKYAQQGELSTQGRPLFKVGDLDNMILRVYITADQLTTLEIGQMVKVYSDQGKKDRKEYQGTVEWISDQAEFTPKTIQTRDERANLVYAVKIAVKNDGLIKRGMYGEIKL
ncbi:MAG: HlyD family efflux transporter periplasmic adaptor subunit [Bacteroidales bacterium]|nr:HlyD family efflux transporter periplasmic adaptor subunit [Bacteroidales bacterium]